MGTEDLRILRVSYLRGPNIWTYRPVIEAWVDLGRFEELPTNKLPGFVERLLAALPGLVEHRCGVGERGGFVQRLHEGTWLGHVLEHVAIELQNRAGMQSGFGKARQTSRPGVYKVVFRSREERVGRAALELARDLVLHCVDGQAFDLAAGLESLTDMVDRYALGPSTANIVRAATDHGVPSIRLNDGNLVQFGYGRQQRRIWTAETDRTSAIAEGIAADKALTKTLLATCGLPVPEGQIAASADDAWEIAEDLGLPVVIKPVDGNHGRGVSLDLHGRDDVMAAFALAAEEGSDVVVERFIRGKEHRALVVGDRLVAMAAGDEAWVVGDGRQTVAELVETQLNADPRRGSSEEFPLNRIDIADDPAIQLDLKRQGLSGEQVPESGRRVLVQRNGNVADDVTPLVHPEVAAAVVLAARVVGLDIAGIDLVAEDVGRPLNEQGGAIVEVNAGPGLLMHLKPASGEPQPVGEAIVRHLMADGDGRIPVIGVSGLAGTTSVARLVARMAAFAGHAVGLACEDGVFFGQRQIDRRHDFEAAQKLLINRNVGLAVFATSPHALLDEGLPYDRCAVGVVLSLSGAEPIPEHDVATAEQWRTVLRTQVDVVLDSGSAVLNADDEAVADLADLCDGAVLLVSANSNSERIARHLSRGQRAVVLQDGAACCLEGSRRIAMVPLPTQPADQVPNLVAAIAAAWAAGLSPDLFAASLADALDKVAEATR